jgi:thermostable 8-oxoguanine DNA glycosylase
MYNAHMPRRLKVHITATISMEAAQFLEEVAQEFGMRSAALDAIILWAKRHGFPRPCGQ